GDARVSRLPFSPIDSDHDLALSFSFVRNDIQPSASEEQSRDHTAASRTARQRRTEVTENARGHASARPAAAVASSSDARRVVLALTDEVLGQADGDWAERKRAGCGATSHPTAMETTVPRRSRRPPGPNRHS